MVTNHTGNVRKPAAGALDGALCSQTVAERARTVETLRCLCLRLVTSILAAGG